MAVGFKGGIVASAIDAAVDAARTAILGEGFAEVFPGAVEADGEIVPGEAEPGGDLIGLLAV